METKQPHVSNKNVPHYHRLFDWKKHGIFYAWKESEETLWPQKTNQARAVQANIALALALALIAWGRAQFTLLISGLKAVSSPTSARLPTAESFLVHYLSQFTFTVPASYTLNAVSQPADVRWSNRGSCGQWAPLTWLVTTYRHMPAWKTSCLTTCERARGLRFAKAVDRDRSRILVHINMMVPMQQSSS